jgi:hypothetical protein
MHRRAVLAFFILLGAFAAACASSGTPGTASGNPPPLGSGSPDASGEFVFADDAGSDAGPLLSPCDPTSATSCPTGFLCYPTHTSTTWWVDLYGKCTFDCCAATLALCSSMDGVCGCPVSATGVSEVCSADEEDGGIEGGTTVQGCTGAPNLSPMVCVPAVKPGTTPGSTEGPGGCGGPNCGGGPEAGTPPIEDAGGSEQ